MTINYTSKESLVSRYGTEKLSELIPGDAEGTIDDAKLTYLIGLANAVIDSYIAAIYVIGDSITKIPALEQIANVIVYYSMLDESAFDIDIARHNRAMKDLEAIRDKKLRLTDQARNIIQFAN